MFGRHLRGILRVGPVEYFRQTLRLNEFRGGTLLATDKYGNKYYEMKDGEPDTLFCTVSYRIYLNCKIDEDTSSILTRRTPIHLKSQLNGNQIIVLIYLMNRHAWLHYTTDDPPSQSYYVQPSYGIAHRENMTGTSQRCVPYSTTVDKIEKFQPEPQIRARLRRSD